MDFSLSDTKREKCPYLQTQIMFSDSKYVEIQVAVLGN